MKGLLLLLISILFLPLKEHSEHSASERESSDGYCTSNGLRREKQ